MANVENGPPRAYPARDVAQGAKLTRRDRIAARQSGQAMLMFVLAVLTLSISVFAGYKYTGPKVGLQNQSQATSVTGLAASANIIKVRRALWAFVSRNYRLPCPADGSAPTGGAGLDGTADGADDCSLVAGGAHQANANRGTVPWKALGLTASDALDGYQHRIGYAVSNALASGTPFKTSPPPVTQNTIAVSVNGASTVCASSTNCYAYVLVSYGADGAGGWLGSGNQAAVPATTVYEYSNTQAAAFRGNQTTGAGTTCNAGTTAFQVCPAVTTLGSNSYFDDTLVFETANQICQDANGNRASANWVVCSTNGGSNAPGTANQNSSSALTSANGGTITNTACQAATYCPGSSNAGSAANTFAFVGGGGSSLTNGNSLSLVAGLGTVSVGGTNGSSVYASGVQAGNSAVGQNGDWIGANQTNSCAACAATATTPNYTIPGETIVYNFTNSYYSFAFADYLVDGGMQVQVDGYLSSNLAITGNVVNGSSTVGGISSTTDLAVGQSVEGSATYSSLLPSGTTITGVVAGSSSSGPGQITLSQAVNLTSSTGSYYVAPSGTSFTSLTGTTTAGSQLITNASSTAGLASGENIAGLGISAGVSLTVVSSTELSLSLSATGSDTNTPLFVTPSAAAITTVTGTVSTSAPLSITNISSVAGLVAGQAIAGLGVQSGTRITFVDAVHNGITVSKSLEPAAPSTTINVVANSYTIAASVTKNSPTVTGIASTTNLVAGMTVTGAGIPDGTYILSVDSGSQITLTADATATAANADLFVTPWTKVGTMILSNAASGTINNGVNFTGDLTAGNLSIANVSSAAYLSDIGVSAGAPLAGYGIPAGTYVTAISSDSITMSQAAAVTVTTDTLVVQPASLIVTPFTGTISSGSKAVTAISSSAGLTNNSMMIEGVGISSGVSITAVSSTGLSLSASATLSATSQPLFVSPRIPVSGITGTVTYGSNVLSGLSSVANLAVGDFITGFGIPAGSLITAVSANLSSSSSLSVTISQVATASESRDALIAGYYPPLTAASMIGSVSGTSVTASSSNALPFVGETMSVANVPANTVIRSVAGTAITLSQSASAALSSTSLYPTYAPCPGPATTGTENLTERVSTTVASHPNGLYADYSALEGVYSAGSGANGDPAPIAQHPGATAAANIPSQQWPQPGMAGSEGSDPSSLAGNYADQRDNQFYNRMFTDSYGTPLKFNVLVFQVLPYVYPTTPTTWGNRTTTCTQDSSGRLICNYGMLFEGLNACYNDTYSSDCTMLGNDEWWNPPVAETMDCGQRPS